MANPNGKGKPWTDDEISFLLENYTSLTHKEIGMQIGRTSKAVNAKCKILKLSKPHFRFTTAQIEELKRNFANTSNQELANRFGCTIYGILSQARRLKLKKTAEHISLMGKLHYEANKEICQLTQFRKGKVSWNKGKKIGSHPNSAKTQFKKGQPARNKMPVGTELINTDGYWKVKVAEPNIWKEKHRLIWVKANGEIPEGMCLAFKDRNSKNCVLENIEIITREEIMLRNTIHNYPPELKETIQTLGRLKRQINRRNKNAEKQN